MTKPDTTSTTSKTNENTEPNILQPFWLLKTGTAKKLGKQTEGGISYQILTDSERQEPMIKITGNFGGGYFSKETVPFQNVEACIDKHAQGQPFPSKLFQAAFTGRSSNNAAFLAAILRTEGLLALAPDTEGRHIISSDWNEWKASLLAEPGQRLETEATSAEGTQSESQPEPDQTQSKKTLTLPRRKK